MSSPLAAIHEHRRICDELHGLALEENRVLRQHQRAPDAAFLARKQQLLVALEQSLAALRAIPAGLARDADTRGTLERVQDRILQIVQLDKENEQLLLRYSLSTPRPTAASGSAAMLQKIYSRSTSGSRE